MSDGDLVFDSVNQWLNDHPGAAMDAPDLVAIVQKLARDLEDAEPKDVIGLVREYRMYRDAIMGVIGGDGDEDDVASAMRAAVRDGEKQA